MYVLQKNLPCSALEAALVAAGADFIVALFLTSLDVPSVGNVLPVPKLQFPLQQKTIQ